jgi:SAM-dependent methyltransferase
MSLLIVFAAAVLLLLVWEIWICEGAHLGRRFVVLLYDLLAGRFESIKQFDWDWEKLFLGEPLAASLAHLGRSRILDVGAGTGRLARAFLPVARGDVKLVAVEPSVRMVRLGRRLCPPTFPWLRAWADQLPFPSGSFDVVAALELTEFTPNPRKAVQEMVRVLRPGGLLLITNRVGWEAPWIVGRTVPRPRFVQALTPFGLTDIRVEPWQVEYDLAWAYKG